MAVFEKRASLGKLLRIAAAGAALVILFAAVWFGVRDAAEKSRDEGTKILQKSLSRAAVQCYALEGLYPPDVDYMEEHYGVQYDHEKYAIYYEMFAFNVMPEITVVLQ